MANINFLNTVDLNQNQLNKAAIQNLAVDPISGVLGQIIFNTAEGNLKVCVTASPTSAVWSSAQGDVKSVLGGTYITVADENGPNPTVNHDATSRTDSTSTLSDVAFPVVDSVTTNATGHVTGVNIKTVTVPGDTYDLTTAPTGTAVRLTGSLTGVDDVTVSGTTGQTATSRISDTELRVALTSDVTIANDLSLTNGAFTQIAGGQNKFEGQVTIPTTPVASTDAASKNYVDQSNIGQSVFQGGYNASTNDPDLDTTSNIAVTKGWFWAVTNTGDFWTETVQPGDLIYADVDQVANNAGNDASKWVVVQSGQDIASAASTDALAVKGIAGFDSEHFTVTTNGWAQLKPQSNPYGATVLLTSGVDSGGETTFTVDVTALFGTGALAENCITEVVTTSGRGTVYASIGGNGTGSLTFSFAPVVADDVYTALISYI